MQHRRPADFPSILRALVALLVAAALGSAVLAAAGGSRRDPAAAVLQIARQQSGDPYSWGGNGPDAWDCSGLTSYMWREVGGVESIPRVSRDQQAWAVPIPREQLLVGDLVFFGNPVSHVALYAGMGKILDASAAEARVLERPLWTTGVVRYGRVPRPHMPAVKPWTPPPPPPLDVTSPEPRAAADAVHEAPRGPTAAEVAAARRVRTNPAAVARLVPLPGLPGRNIPASAVAARAARSAATVRGASAWTDVQLVRVAWHHAGGGVLPPTLADIVTRTQPVTLDAARIGDFVLYGKPASHIAIYLGHGYMVDASPSLRRVVVRRVFVSPTVRLVRLPAT